MQSAPGSIDTSNIVSVCFADGRLDRDLLKEMLGYFLDENRRRMLALVEAVRDGDRETLGNVAHALRGSAAMFGAGHLHDLGWALEDDAATGSDEGLRRAVEALVTEFTSVMDALREAHPDAWPG